MPFVARPFEGLSGETEWVALREILPAATAALRLRSDVDAPQATDLAVASFLPMGWAGLHRDTGARLVSARAGADRGDRSRSLAASLTAVLRAPAGSPVDVAPAVDADTPRLQDLLDPQAPVTVQVHDGFDFWVEGADVDEEARASLEEANTSVTPTVAIPGAASVYWCRMGARCYVRWVLPYDEDRSTDALARLHARGASRLSSTSRLLGAFRACGLLVPVWEVDADQEPAGLADAVGNLAPLLAEAAASQEPLDQQQRSSRNGLVSRQVTLR